MKIFINIVLPAAIAAVFVFIIFLRFYISNWEIDEFYPLKAANSNARAIHGFFINYADKSKGNGSIPAGKYFFRLNVRDEYDAAYDGTLSDLENYIGSAGFYGFCCVKFENNIPVQVWWCREEFPEITAFATDLSQKTCSDRYLYRNMIAGFPQETVPSDNFFLRYEDGINISAFSALFVWSLGAAVLSLKYLIRNKKVQNIM